MKPRQCIRAVALFTLTSVVIVSLLSAASLAVGEAIFLDNSEGVINGSTTYDPGTRTCGQGTYRVSTTLDEAARTLLDADALYIRTGTYTRASVGNYITVHGHQVNYFTGALDIAASGTAQRRKLVSAYHGEMVIIQAKSGASHYNPDPGDTSFTNSSHYYPHPAIGIHGTYVDVVGLRTYGQVVITGHDVTLEYCDLGGGGPHMNQGQVVAINTNRPGGVYNVVVRNNRIHHSCWGESKGNGAAVMGYNFSATIENNHFYDNYGADVRIKDCGDQEGRTAIVRYNVFGPTAICPNGNTGVGGMNQDKDIDRILIHNNIFYKKGVGVSCDGPPEGPPPKGMFIYNNTFVDCDVDLSEWTNPVIHAHNNLFYHFQAAQRFYDIQSDPWTQLDTDHNLFFSAVGDTQWRHLYRNRASSLLTWQQYSSKDTRSVWKDPQFANPGYWDSKDTPDDPNDDVFVEGDYHPKSQAGRWDPNSESWVQDDVTSPCIDAGDPNGPIGDEPFPNGGVINMGAYGGTREASKSYFGESLCQTIIAGDINGDCKVDFLDLAILTQHWLAHLPPQMPADEDEDEGQIRTR